MKGISPLIAAVLLIAFTMAIAGIMATWATQFVRTQTNSISSNTNCIGALDIGSLYFSDGNVSVTVYNKDTKINLTGLKAYLEYTDTSKNSEFILKNYGVSDPLPAASRDWAIINTSYNVTPKSIEIFATNCPDYPARSDF